MSYKALGKQEGCSYATIQRTAATDGISRFIMRRALIINETMRLKRLQWCKDNQDTGWRQVLWTDKVPLTIGKDPRQQWVSRGPGNCHES